MKIVSLTAVTLGGSSRTIRQLCADNSIALTVVGLSYVIISAAIGSGGSAGTPLNFATGTASASTPYFNTAAVSSSDLDSVQVYGPSLPAVIQVIANDSNGPLPAWM